MIFYIPKEISNNYYKDNWKQCKQFTEDYGEFIEF